MPSFQTHRGRVLPSGPTGMVVAPIRLSWARCAPKAPGTPNPMALQGGPTSEASGRDHLAGWNQGGSPSLWNWGGNPEEDLNHLWHYFFLFFKNSIYSQPNSSWSVPVGSKKSNSLPSFCPIFSVLFSPSWQYFCHIFRFFFNNKTLLHNTKIYTDLLRFP